MRSTRLAVLAVTVGAGLLAWSTAGVGGIARTLAADTPSQVAPAPGRADGGVAHDVRGRGHEHGDCHGARV